MSLSDHVNLNLSRANKSQPASHARRARGNGH